MAEKIFIADKPTLDEIKNNTDEIKTKTDEIKNNMKNTSNNIILYTTPGVYQWTPPEGVEIIKVSLVGGGGGGGSAGVQQSQTVNYGGEAGEDFKGFDNIANLIDGRGGGAVTAVNTTGKDALGVGGGGGGASYKLTTGATGGQTNGTAGGVTSFDNIISASGGSGGAGRSNSGEGGAAGSYIFRKEVKVAPGAMYTLTVGAKGKGVAGTVTGNTGYRGGYGGTGAIVIEW